MVPFSALRRACIRVVPGLRALAAAGLVLLWCGAGAPPPPSAGGEVRAQVEVQPREGAVGDRLRLTVTVEVPEGLELPPPGWGERLGPFRVWGDGWSEPEPAGPGLWRYVWLGEIAAFEPGEAVLPPLELRLRRRTPGGDEDAGEVLVVTEPVPVNIHSVLEGMDPLPELADIKGPASLPPDWGPLRRGLALVALLLGLSLLLWWLHRRVASRLRAVPAPEDPFRRLPPHVWIYQEIERLLDRRWVEQGRADRFVEALSQLFKRYLEGRFRVDLRDKTTSELVRPLTQAGCPAELAGRVQAWFGECDAVKFAGLTPDADTCRRLVDTVYALVDRTRPEERLEGAA